MAGGWEEVTTAAGWTGTGAGTGVELNKHGEADEAAVGRLGAGEGCSASKLYLVDVWGSSDLEFSQEVNAQDRTSHSGLQKTG